MQVHARSITDATVSWPGWDEVIRTLTLRAGHNSAVVVLAATMLGLAAGVVGTFALLRKRAMMGDCLAHCTLPGIGLAFLVATWMGHEGRSLPVLLLGAAVSAVLGILCVQGIVRGSRLRDDAAIGAVLGVFFGTGVVLLSVIQGLRSGNQGGLSHFIYGQTAAMSRSDAYVMGGVALGAILIAGAMFKEFRIVCFDDRFAATQGMPVARVDLLMMTLVVVVTVIGLQAVGLVLVVALLIIPAAAARFWTERLGVMVVLSGGIGALSGYLGATASALLPRMPAGAVIVLTAGVIFLVCFTLAPARGVVASAVRLVRVRVRIASDHYLRAMYEVLEARGDLGAGSACRMNEIGRGRAWSGATTSILTAWLRARGMIRTGPGGAALTERGLADGRRVTRNHRLWEEFLVSHAHLAASHVDRSADMVEHSLSPEVVAELEASLRKRGTLPGVPESIHPTGPGAPELEP